MMTAHVLRTRNVKPCNQCGKCCLRYSDGGLSATASEIDWWELHRPEIFQYTRDGKIWMDPETGTQLVICPWLRKLSVAGSTHQARYSCDIYHDRPDDCRHYPVTVDEMVRDECEMIEVRDLTNPVAAQTRLDLIMSDSRPPRQ